MADNVPITPGSGANVATDERTISGTAVQVQRVDEQGAVSFAVGQVAPTTTATSASIAGRDTRKRITLINHGAYDVYLSHQATPTATTSNALKIPPGAGFTLQAQASIYLFTATGTGSIHYADEYD